MEFGRSFLRLSEICHWTRLSRFILQFRLRYFVEFRVSRAERALLTAKIGNKAKNYSHMTGATAQLGTTASKRVVLVLQGVSSKPPLVSPLQSCLVEGVTAMQD